MAESNINLVVNFDTTADTPRVSAAEIAGRVRLYLAVELDLANVRVKVDGAALNYREAYEADKAQPDVLKGRGPTISPYGNPSTDARN